MLRSASRRRNIDERMSIIGTEGLFHVQDTFPNLGIVGKDKF
jgi:UDP-N-acetylglucosamine 3-dehydrogenase